MSEKLKQKLKDEEIHGRLCNWGRWLRFDSSFAKLGYPSQAPFVFSPGRGYLVADQDAEHIEFIVSSLHLSGLDRGLLYSFILKVEYAERPGSAMPHVSQRAEDVRKRFKCPCAESTYYQHLAKAKSAIDMFAGPLK